MRYWDSSALVPIILEESHSSVMRERLGEDPGIVAWWGTQVEVASAIAREERRGFATEEQAEQAIARLRSLSEKWHEVEPCAAVRDTAVRLLRTHPLRAADALQLAAAVVAAEHRPDGLPFICLDERLQRAARKEGFAVVGA
jgi:uncharacterized protein